MFSARYELNLYIKSTFKLTVTGFRREGISRSGSTDAKLQNEPSPLRFSGSSKICGAPRDIGSVCLFLLPALHNDTIRFFQ